MQAKATNVSMSSSLEGTSSSRDAMVQVYVRARIGCRSRRAALRATEARLALAGWEANVQEGAVPDKGVRYRVRLGPYDDADELNRMKAELARRGFDVAVIRF